MIAHASCGYPRMYVRQAGTPSEMCVLLLTQVPQNTFSPDSFSEVSPSGQVVLVVFRGNADEKRFFKHAAAHEVKIS